jgi:hypothetical protein
MASGDQEFRSSGVWENDDGAAAAAGARDRSPEPLIS